jgi:predicted regulator of Ras-like GTPase activity (Roadblock/LC7/MglB family)
MNTASASLGRTDQIQDVLRALRASSSDIAGVALVSADGFTASSVLPRELEEEIVGGLSATFRSSADRVVQELLGASLEQAYVKTRNGFMIVNQMGADAALVVLANDNARLGLLLLEINRRAQQLLRLL